jgi:ubiquitin-protein ligase
MSKPGITMKRLLHEKQEIEKENSPYFNAAPVGDNLFEWNGYINGPDSSVYRGFKYYITIVLTTSYPFDPPVVKFTTPIFHPNVNEAGEICHQVLKKDGWSPSLRINKVLLTLYDMMDNPYPDSALNMEAAMMLRSDPSAMRARVEAMAAANMSVEAPSKTTE